MRAIVPERIGLRGAGLGNELISWAKAFLGAESLGCRYLDPVWGLNPRGYRRYFGTSRVDWAWDLVRKGTVRYRRFSEDDYLSTGEEDFGAAFRIWAAREGLVDRRRWLVGVGGMWGGFWSVRRARSFLEAKLAATRFTQENLACVRGRLDPSMPLCVVHVRGGDFAENRSEESIQGKFNVRIDPAWYSSAIDAVLDLTKGRVNILVISNARPEELENLTSRCQVMTTAGLANSDISDLLLAARADILVPSVSSFSMQAIFLGADTMYLWPREHLSPVEGSEEMSAIWAGDANQRAPGSATRSLAATPFPGGVPRGIPFSRGDAIDSRVGDWLDFKNRLRIRRSDLLYYGSVPSNAGMRHPHEESPSCP